jgi:hypothetical protein
MAGRGGPMREGALRGRELSVRAARRLGMSFNSERDSRGRNEIASPHRLALTNCIGQLQRQPNDLLFREPNITLARNLGIACVRPEESAPLVSRATHLDGLMKPYCSDQPKESAPILRYVPTLNDYNLWRTYEDLLGLHHVE